jgi:hypothetical protein
MIRMMKTVCVRFFQAVLFKPLIGIILIALITVSLVFFLNPYREWIIATYDYKFGDPKYYFYGLIDEPSSKYMDEKLKEKNITAVLGGCMIGGSEYKSAMKYNKVIESYLPQDYFENINNIN